MNEYLKELFLACYDNELIALPDQPGGDLALVTNEEDLLAVAGSSSFLPRVQLYGASSDACKEGKISIAHWGIVRGKDQIEDLGKEFNALVLGGRVKALDLSSDEIVTSYDRTSDVFASIQARSEEDGSKCMFGPEFLIYLPSSKDYATCFLSSPTARREAKSLFARIKKAATFKSKLIEGKRFKWHGPVFTACTTPFEIPPMDEITVQLDRFLNPREDAPELAPKSATEGGTEERAR